MAMANGKEGLAPKLSLEPRELALGTFAEHETIMVEVLVLNHGTEELHIEDIGSTCPGCLEFDLQTNRVPPEGFALLTLWVDAGRLGEALKDNPDQETYLLIQSNDPVSPYLGIPIHADVKPAFEELQPPFLFHGLTSNEVRRGTVKLREQTPMKAPLSNVEVDVPFLVASVRPDPTWDDTTLVDFETVPPIPVGWQQATAVVRSANPEDPTCRIELSLYTPPPFHTYPATLKIGPLAREQFRIVFIDQYLQPPARIVDVDVPDSGVSFEYQQDLGLFRSRLNLYIVGMKGRDGYLGDVVLRTDHPEVDAVRIPIMISPAYSQPYPDSDPFSSVRSPGCCGDEREK